MKNDQRLYDIFDKRLHMPEGVDGTFGLAWMFTLWLNAIGAKVISVIGTAIGGALSGANKIFTRTSGFWIRTQTLTTGAITGTYTVGEAITQASTSAAGVVTRVETGSTTNYIVIDTITVAAFNGTNIVTGSTSGATATPTAVSTELDDLAGFQALAHVSGAPEEGEYLRVVSNTATTFTTEAAMPAAATAAILYDSVDSASNALRIGPNAGSEAIMQAQAASAATVSIASNATISNRVVIATTASNAVALTLPDIRLVDENQQIMVYVSDATTNAFTLVAYLPAQTLDGTDISATGTPLATLDADGDYIIIQRNGLVWVTVQDGIA